MSELTQTLWAVVSYRGCEASGLDHQAALDLLSRLARENRGPLHRHRRCRPPHDNRFAGS